MDEGDRADKAGTSDGRDSVLLVDDDALIQMVAADVLRRAGLHVLEARDAAEALRLINSGGVASVVLTDAEMPGPRDEPLPPNRKAESR